ncbi:hypothetical protein ACP4OV_005384 [Aristida adscensionis]
MPGGEDGHGNNENGLLGFIVALVFWKVIADLPFKIRADVGPATLSGLAVVSNASSSSSSGAGAGTVSYHLSVAVVLYNRRFSESVYYDTIDSTLRSGDAVLAPAASETSPAEFHQGKRGTDFVNLEFDGRGVGVSGDAAAELEKETAGGRGPVSL